MPLDHFVSQVHLKNFYSPSLGNRLYAINKKDLKEFTPRSEDVCRIKDGSTNVYLREDRAVEEFMKNIEPRYNAAVAKLASNKIDRECIFTIAGFVAYVISCSPASMRLESNALQSAAEMEAFMLDSKGLIPASPPELGGINLKEILEKWIVNVDVDPKFPQAIGIASILKNTAMLGNFKWEVLRNDFEDSAYFTSDYPVAIEAISNLNVRNKIIPLSPSHAIRICPDRKVDREQADLTFANFACQNKRLGRREVAQINKLIVQCAEELVFFRDNHPWVSRFIHKNSQFRIEARTQKVPHGTEMVMFYSQDIAETKKNEKSSEGKTV